MKTILQKKTTIYPGIIALLFVISFNISCKKDLHDNTDIPGETIDLSTKINSSVSGFVTDENNAPVIGADVKSGTGSAITNQFGYFELKNIEVVKQAAFVTITKAGYFKGIKTWAATENKAAFFRIKLIPKTIAGTISSSAGGNVNLSNGLNIVFPASAVVTASTGAAYTGNFNVAAYWIDPESTELNKIMPGDLRGIDELGLIKGLTTYGMAAVELTGASGELLQIATGKKATITMPLSATLAASASSSIPLWYFDETNGLWKEEGAAIKTGNGYVGEVSHFTYWNCDLPNATVPLTFTVVDESNHPLANTYVDITPAGTAGYAGHVGGYTDATGYVAVFVTPNTTYNLNVLSFINCGVAPAYTQAFSVNTSAVDLGNIVVGTATNGVASISGTMVDCSNNPVANGQLMVWAGYDNYYLNTDNNGNFNFGILICSPLDINIVGLDLAQGQQGSLQTFSINIGANTLANVQACGTQVLSYISNGYFYHPSGPRTIDNRPKILTPVNDTTFQFEFGDLGGSGYIAELAVNSVTNQVTVNAAPGAAGAPYMQWNDALPSTNPGYTPQWAGSDQCNNKYDPATHIYYLRYGYIGGTGYRVSEEILTPQ